MNHEILYTYIKSVIFNKEDITMEVVDTLKYNTSDFFEQINKTLLLKNTSNDNISIINLFCITSTKDKIKKIKKTLSTEIINRIDLGKNFENTYNSPDMFNQYLNVFINYLFDNNLAPLIYSFELDNISVLYMFGGTSYYKQASQEVKSVLNMWYETEQPILLGKQIITQTFFYKNLIGRKIIDIVSSYQNNNLYLLLEGNIKIKLDYDSVSSYNYLDTNHFTINDLQRILYDPIYCFGYSFNPYILFLDWFEIYLYSIALLNIDLQNFKNLKLSYNTFLDFIDKNICEKIYTDKPYLNENLFYDILKINIENINKYLKR